MGYKAIIWDLDGTLLDTLQDLAGAVNHSLEAYSLPVKTKEEIRASPVDRSIISAIGRTGAASVTIAAVSQYPSPAPA